MKHVVRVVAVLGIVAVPAAAQAQVSVGVRVGANMATLSNDNDFEMPVELQFDLENVAGLTAGAFVTVPVTTVFAFQPEVLYSRQGAKLRQSGSTTRLTLDYIQVPLLARVRTGSQSRLSVLFGPTLGFKTGARQTWSGTFAGDDSGAFDEHTKTFDFGLTAGAGLDVGPLVLDARYTWGLTDITKPLPNPMPIDSATRDSGDTDSWKNRALSFSAGLRF